MLQWWQSGMLTELDATGAPSALFLLQSQIAGIRPEMSGQLQCHPTRQTLLVTRAGEARNGYGRDRESGGAYSTHPAELSKICLARLPNFRVCFAKPCLPRVYAAALRR